MKGFILTDDEQELIRDALIIAYEDHEDHAGAAQALQEKLGGGLEAQSSYIQFVENLMSQIAASHGIKPELLTRSYPLPTVLLSASEVLAREKLEKFTNPNLGKPYPNEEENNLDVIKLQKHSSRLYEIAKEYRDHMVTAATEDEDMTLADEIEQIVKEVEG